MSAMYTALAVVIISNVIYHVSIKSIPANAHFIVSTIVMYAVALVATLMLYPFFSAGISLTDEIKKLHWAPFAIGTAIVGIEIGFLLAYRNGLNVSYGAVLAHSMVAVLLIPLGILLFREKLNLTNVAGIVMCVIGLFLIMRK